MPACVLTLLTVVVVIRLSRQRDDDPSTPIQQHSPPQREWTRFTDPKRKVTILFPHPPTQQPVTEYAQGPLHERIKDSVFIWVCTDGDTRYTLSLFYPPNDFVNARLTLEELAQSGEAAPDLFRVVARRELTIDGEPGRQTEVVGRSRDEAGVDTFIRAKGFAVTLLVAGPVGTTAESENVKKFLSSFRFVRD